MRNIDDKGFGCVELLLVLLCIIVVAIFTVYAV